MIMSLRTSAHAGVAIRIPIPCRITDIYRENGLPRQSSDWRGNDILLISKKYPTRERYRAGPMV